MQSFFDQLLSLNVPIVNEDNWPIDVEDLPKEDQERFYYNANVSYENLIKIQFQLCYHANISIRDADNMSVYEYLMFYDELKAQKKEEKDQIEQAQSR